MLNEFAGNRKVSGEAIGRDETLHHTSHEILINYLFTDLFIYLLFLFIYLFIYYLHNNKKYLWFSFYLQQPRRPKITTLECPMTRVM